MFERNAVTPAVVRHVDRCLSCLSCMSTCPSGVDYMHLVDLARSRIAAHYRRPLADRLRRRFLAKALTGQRLFALASLLAWVARPLAPLAKRLRLRRLAAALSMVPARPPRLRPVVRNPLQKAGRRPVRRVALLLGCVQESLREEINSAAIRLLNRHGVDVVVFEEQTCCGAIEHHLAEDDAALARVRRNVDAWSAELRNTPLDAILLTASGCGTMVKDYGNLLARDRGYAGRAAEISHLAMDISEFIEAIGLTAPVIWGDLKVAYHSPCSLQHGQGLDRTPRALLRQAGFRVLDLPENHLCCGSAGTYSLLQPELSAALRTRKLRLINQIQPDVVATGNIGCLMQLNQGNTLPIVHTVELLDWATGGPCPGNLKALAAKEQTLRSLVESAAS
jgi:glycolate dehydrogenase iron-sulfur subunit